MKLYRPCKTDLITQTFGVNGTQPSLLPLYNSLGLKAHDGYDFCVSCADNYTKTGGKCEEVFNNVVGDGELEITFMQKDIDKGFGIMAVDQNWNKFIWWHFDSIDPLIYVGKKLQQGDRLGVAGNTGMSTGAHIHFAYYKYGEDYNNGYHGASDIAPYFDNRFVVDIVNQIGIIQKTLAILKAILEILKK